MSLDITPRGPVDEFRNNANRWVSRYRAISPNSRYTGPPEGVSLSAGGKARRLFVRPYFFEVRNIGKVR